MPTTDESGITWMTRAEAAEHARVGVRTIDRWANEGRITRYKADDMQSTRYRRDELDAMFRPEEAEPTPAGASASS